MNKHTDETIDNQQVSFNGIPLVPIPDLERYWTDGFGEIFSTRKVQLRKLKKRIHYGKSKNPYIRTKVANTNALAHRVIASVHLNRQLHRHEVVNHINGITTDNSLENLEVVSHSDNVKHAVENKLYCQGADWYAARGIN